jgi:organic hydroperoxide reductase OsmC/OhrA
MAETEHEARVAWEPLKRDLRAHRVTAGGQVFEGSCAWQLGGDPGKADPEELFVASLAACHMLWFLDLSRRERLRVKSYEDEAAGVMDGERFVRVALRPLIEWDGEAPSEEKVAALHRGAHEHCFIARSVNCPVEVEAPVWAGPPVGTPEDEAA